MKRLMILAAAVMLAVPVMADTFGTGDNQFTIEFVPISGDAGDLGNWSAGHNYTFSGVNSGDYRMGKFEITNAQFAKFASNSNVYWTGDDVPSNMVSWFEAAQFVNWLNTSHNHQAAYNFNGGTFGLWDASDAWGGTNLYRHKDAYYFLPTEDEWVKAAYWNGSALQTYATKAGESLYQGNGTNGGWNYYDDNGWATNPYGPWNVGSGSEELNGTFDMMGNVWEWMESPYYTGNYASGSIRGIRGGSIYYFDIYGDILASSYRNSSYHYPEFERDNIGFRVASIPEPCTLVLLGVGGMLIRKRK